MSLALLVVSLLAADAPGAAQFRVYRFKDARGTEHYVDQLTQVPEGIAATPVDLTDVPLNPETAKALADATEKVPKPLPKVIANLQPPSEEANRMLLWSTALSFAFVGLALLRWATKKQLPQLATAFRIVGFAAGSLALMSWAVTAYEYRGSHGWLSEHFPPLRVLDQALQTKQQVDRQREQMEHDIDQGLRGH